MSRAFLLTTSEIIREIEVEPRNYTEPDFQFLSLVTLNDRFSDEEEGQPVLITLPNRGNGTGEAYNASASALLAPVDARKTYFIRGEALVLWERVSEDGYDLSGIPDSIGLEDMRDLVRYWKLR